MFSLTRALQIELGVTPPSDSFGPATTTALDTHGPITASTASVNLRKIVQASLYCKGYPGGGIDGIWGSSTASGIQGMKSDMGLGPGDASINTKVMKSLLTMDAYTVLWDGNQMVRAAQQWLNATFVSRRDFSILPCDGIFSRNVQRGIVYALQYSLGMTDGTANGVFGPATRSALNQRASLKVGTADSGPAHFVRIFKALLLCNRQISVDWPNPSYTATTQSVTRAFQQFCGLSGNGDGDYATWASLLVSTGDPSRPATGSDCRTPLNQARIDALKADGYRYVGRYIVGGEDKMMTSGEADLIIRNNLRLFPIFQEWNNGPTHFSYDAGRRQALGAVQNATDLNIPFGSIIYFACDWDPTAQDIRALVIPYFQGVNDSFAQLGYPYRVGAYGTRNVCQVVHDAGLASTSFVAGLSTGWSGNLGYPLPSNWAIDQIATVTIGAGTAGQLEIDRDVVSGRDPGVASLTGSIDPNAAFWEWLAGVEDAAREAQGMHPGYTVADLTAHVIRSFNPLYLLPNFDALGGPVVHEFVIWARSSVGAMPDLYDPVAGGNSGLAHFGMTYNICRSQTPPTPPTGASLQDFGGWAGDLVTLSKEYYARLTASDEATAYQAGLDAIAGKSGVFARRDLIADVDGFVLWSETRNDPSRTISSVLKPYYSSTKATRTKYTRFIAERFGTKATMTEASISALSKETSDSFYATARAALWSTSRPFDVIPDFGWAHDAAPQVFTGLGRSFADVVARMAG